MNRPVTCTLLTSTDNNRKETRYVSSCTSMSCAQDWGYHARFNFRCYHLRYILYRLFFLYGDPFLIYTIYIWDGKEYITVGCSSAYKSFRVLLCHGDLVLCVAFALSPHYLICSFLS